MTRELREELLAVVERVLATLAAADLAELLEPVATAGRWTQTAGCVAAPPYDGFLEDYAHTALLGPASVSPAQ